MIFELSELKPNNVYTIGKIRSTIDVEPEYQRQGGVWGVDKKALLIDSLINGFDIPKIYLHEHRPPKNEDGRMIKYSVIDGRQRLESVWGFLNDEFPLSEDFEFFEDSNQSLSAQGKTFSQLKEENHPALECFNAAQLDIVKIDTEDISLIEEMFSRLNEAVPLSAAEKRNGSGGPLRDAVNSLVRSAFFSNRIRFKDSRYRYFDIATKLLLFTKNQGPQSTKKRDLDLFWQSYKEAPSSLPSNLPEVDTLVDTSMQILEEMAEVFIENDPLLRNAGTISIYFLLFQKLRSTPLGIDFQLTREMLCSFEDTRRGLMNKTFDESSLSLQEYSFIEFDRLAQSSNDKGALTTRVNILLQYLKENCFLPLEFEVD